MQGRKPYSVEEAIATEPGAERFSKACSVLAREFTGKIPPHPDSVLNWLYIF
jgi:hypothetical protein